MALSRDWHCGAERSLDSRPQRWLTSAHDEAAAVDERHFGEGRQAKGKKQAGRG